MEESEERQRPRELQIAKLYTYERELQIAKLYTYALLYPTQTLVGTHMRKLTTVLYEKPSAKLDNILIRSSRLALPFPWT